MHNNTGSSEERRDGRSRGKGLLQNVAHLTRPKTRWPGGVQGLWRRCRRSACLWGSRLRTAGGEEQVELSDASLAGAPLSTSAVSAVFPAVAVAPAEVTLHPATQHREECVTNSREGVEHWIKGRTAQVQAGDGCGTRQGRRAGVRDGVTCTRAWIGERAVHGTVGRDGSARCMHRAVRVRVSANAAAPSGPTLQSVARAFTWREAE